MCCTQCVAPNVLHKMCCTQCVAPNVLHKMCCTQCVAPNVLHKMCCTKCAAPNVLHKMCCTKCVARNVLHKMCCTTCAAQVRRGCCRRSLHTYSRRINKSSVNPKSTSNQSSKPCTVLQYPSRKVFTPTPHPLVLAQAAAAAVFARAPPAQVLYCTSQLLLWIKIIGLFCKRAL